MDKIKSQSSKVGELLFSADTGTTYKKTLTLTWDILRETGILLWLTLCLVFVGIGWFWKTSIGLGRQARTRYESFTEPSREEPKTAGEIGQSVATSLGYGTANLLYHAKQQLGMQAEQPTPPTPKPATSKAIARSASPADSTPPKPKTEATVGVMTEKTPESKAANGTGAEEE